MTRAQYLKRQAYKKRAINAEHKGKARETMRVIRSINPDWSYDKCLVAAYIANGHSNMNITKHNL